MFPGVDLRAFTDRKVQEFLAPFLPGFIVCSGFLLANRTLFSPLADFHLYTKVLLGVLITYAVGSIVFALVVLTDGVLTVAVTIYLSSKSTMVPAEDLLWRKVATGFLPPKIVPGFFYPSRMVEITQANLVKSGQTLLPQHRADASAAAQADMEWQRIHSALNSFFGINANADPQLVSTIAILHCILFSVLVFQSMPTGLPYIHHWGARLICFLFNVVALLLLPVMQWGVAFATRSPDRQIAEMWRVNLQNQMQKSASASGAGA